MSGCDEGIGGKSCCLIIRGVRGDLRGCHPASSRPRSRTPAPAPCRTPSGPPGGGFSRTCRGGPCGTSSRES